MIPALAFVVAMTLAACGDNNGGGNPTPTPTPTRTPTPTPTPTWSMTPTPTGGAGGWCAPPYANPGRRVIYAGPQGNMTFPDANATYVGQIVDGTIGTFVHVLFPHLASPIYRHEAFFLFETTCTPSVVNRPVIYNGPAVPGKFPAPAAPPAYSGTITGVYISGAAPFVGWFEVAWGAPLNRTIAVKFSEIYY
jgi:hypothetical protein